MLTVLAVAPPWGPLARRLPPALTVLEVAPVLGLLLTPTVTGPELSARRIYVHHCRVPARVAGWPILSRICGMPVCQ